MIHKIILAAILILSGNQIFSQDSIKGRIIDYETNQTTPGFIQDKNDNSWGSPSPAILSDLNGDFKIKVEGNKRNLEISFIGFYYIKIINIPKEDKTIDLKEIKLVRDHFQDHFVVGGPSRPFSEEQTEKDKKLRIDVLEKYRINILGKNLKPYFEEGWKQYYEKKFMVFDFDKNENE